MTALSLAVPLLGAIVTLVTVIALALESRPLVARVDDDGFSVGGLIYRARLAFGEITQLTIEESLPAIVLKTNGFAAFGRLRGHFRLAELGSGRVFIDAKAAPYIVAKTKASFVVVNLGERSKTEALYRDLEHRWRK